MLLNQLEELRDSLARIDRERDEHMRRRDEFILTALEQKVPVPEIVSASGVNRARVYQIRAAHKEDKS